MSKVINTILNLKDNFSNGLRRTSENTKKFTANLYQAEKAANKIQSSFGAVSKAVLGFGAAVTGFAIVGGTKSFLDFDSALRQAASSTGTTIDQLDKLKSAMKGVYGNNFGESWEDVGASVASVQKYLRGTGNDIQKATENAIAFRDVFGYEVSESMRSVDALIKNFGISSDEAFNLMAQGSQKGLDFSGELIDSINEYSSQFKKIGLGAEDMFNIFASGAENGAWNLDKIGDAMKEFSIRSIDGSNTTIAGFQAIGLNAKEMAEKFGTGGETAKEAFSEVINAIAAIDDPLKQSTAGVSLFGTMWEDLGPTVVTQLTKVGSAFDKSKNTMTEINKIKYTSFSSAIGGIKRQLEVVALPIGEALLPQLNEFAGWLTEKLPRAADQFSQLITANIGKGVNFIKNGFTIAQKSFQYLKEHMDVLIPVLSGIASALGAFVVITRVVRLYDNFKKVTEEVTIVQAILNKTLLTNPIMQIALVIGVLVAAFAIAYQKSETFRQHVQNLWSKLKELGAGIKDGVITKLQELGKWFGDELKPKLDKLQESFMDFWNDVLKPLAEWLQPVFAANFQAAFTFVSSTISTVIETIKGLISGLTTALGGVLNFVTGVFTGNWKLAWSGIKDIFSGILEGIGSIFKGMINSVINGINYFTGKLSWIPEKLSKMPGFSWAVDFTIPKIPNFATGTQYFQGGLARINEHGGEIVNLPGGSQVIPADKSERIINQRNPNITLNINVNGNLLGTEEGARQMGKIIVKEVVLALENM